MILHQDVVARFEEAIPLAVMKPVCTAVQDLIATHEAVDAQMVYDAILQSIPIELMDYLQPCLMRVCSFLQFSQVAPDHLEVDPYAPFFDFEGRLRPCVRRSSLMAALAAPLHLTPVGFSERDVAMSLSEVNRISIALERGEKISIGATLH